MEKAEEGTDLHTMRELLLRTYRDIPYATLRFFGDWFGRPYDNAHALKGVEVRGPALLLTFDRGELLELEEPRGLVVHAGKRTASDPLVTVRSARRVRWTWYHYGRPAIESNRHFIEYELRDSEVTQRTDFAHTAGDLVPSPALAMY